MLFLNLTNFLLSYPGREIFQVDGGSDSKEGGFSRIVEIQSFLSLCPGREIFKIEKRSNGGLSGNFCKSLIFYPFDLNVKIFRSWKLAHFILSCPGS